MGSEVYPAPAASPRGGLTTTISIMIPELDEAANLVWLLPELDARWPYAEVIVVDGGSRDGSRDAVRAHPRVRWVACGAGRARQKNAGACVAAGATLLFLHADTRLPPGALEAVAAALDDPAVVGGRFDVTFDSPLPIM